MIGIDVSDDKSRALAHLVIDTADIFPNNAEGEDHDADKGKENRKQGKESLGLRANNQTTNEKENAEGSPGNRGHETEGADGLNGKQREAGHQIEIESDEPSERILGASFGAVAMRHLDFGNRARECVGQGGNKARDFRAFADLLNDIPPVRAKHTPIIAKLDAGAP